MSLFELLLDDIKIIGNSPNAKFGYKERMSLEKKLFLILKIICKSAIKYEVLGFSKYYRDEIIKKIEKEKLSDDLKKIINRIFELKFFLQSLCSESAYVRADTLSKTGVNKEEVFLIIENRIKSIHKGILEYDSTIERKFRVT